VTIIQYNRDLKTHARDLRQRMTDAEQTLWSKLRRKQIYGVQFYRQKPLGCYIVDFYASGAKLVIELDGSQHFEQAHAQRDAVRDSYLQGLHLRVLRFDNLQVLHELEAVQDEIARVIDERVNPERNQKTNPPQPPFCKGGSETVSTLGGGKDASTLGGSEDVSNFAPRESQSVPPFAKGGLGGIYGLSDSLGIAKKKGIAK
jgi:very-short-patch-repair endonuclease